MPIFKNKSWEIATEKGGNRTSGFDFLSFSFKTRSCVAHVGLDLTIAEDGLERTTLLLPPAEC